MLIGYTPNPVVRKKLNKICLETVGDISWTEYMAVIASAIKGTAIKMQVKLVCWEKIHKMKMVDGR